MSRPASLASAGMTVLTHAMRVTKHEHATLRIQDGDDALIIDPGSFTTPLADLHGLVAVVLTHEHADHWSPAQLDHLADVAPRVPIFGPEGVAKAAADWPITVVHPGDEVTAGRFTLRFFGGRHEPIHSSIPDIDNVGVLVSDRLYYPGDSYAVPEGVAVDTLAAPVGAPWLRLSDAVDFVLAVKPRRAFGTHDMTLSVAGRQMPRRLLRWATEQHGGVFHDLEPGDTLDI